MNFKRFTFFALFSFSIFSSSAQYCSNDNRFTNNPVFGDAEIVSNYSVQYGSAIDWQGNTQILDLDVHYPDLAIDTLAKRPFILMIHGGGLLIGDKSNFTNVCKELAKRGFVTASINYRLGYDCTIDSISKDKAAYRAQQDARAAMRFAVQNASLLRIDTSWMFIGGGSAGSVTALSLVYMNQAEWDLGSPSVSALLGNLDNSGNPLTNSWTIKGVFNNWGAVLEQNLQVEEMVPMVSFHGDADGTVAIDSAYGGGCAQDLLSNGSRVLHARLVQNGICSDLSVRPGGGHGVYEDSLGTIFRVGRVACFFKSLFCSNCQNSYQIDSIPASCGIDAGISNQVMNAYSVYPNPFYTKFQINGLLGNERFELTEETGRVLYVGKSSEDLSSLDIKSGIYFLTIQLEGQIWRYKLVRE